MISSGSTTFFFDFDIFSSRADVSGSPVAAWTTAPSPLERRVGREDPFAGGAAVGLVDHHALREQAGERLVDAEMAGRFMARV